MIVGSFSTEVHQEINSIAHTRSILSRSEDGLVAHLLFLLLFCCRHFCRSTFVVLRWFGCASSEQIPGWKSVVLGGARPAALRRRGSASALEELTKYAAEAVV